MTTDLPNFRSIATDPYHILICEKEAAQLLGWDVRTLQQRRYRGQDPAYVRVGRNIRYRLSVIMDMVKAGEVMPQRAEPGGR